MLKAKLEDKTLWADWELERELEVITQEILRRIESEAIAVGNLEILREPSKNKRKKSLNTSRLIMLLKMNFGTAKTKSRDIKHFGV